MILDEEELQAVGESLGRNTTGPVFVALRGELGAGKSVFARSVARGAGVTGTLPSPTYNLRFDYPLPRGGRIVHMDLYRLAEPDEVWELGWEDLGTPGEIALVEWPDRAEPHLPPDRWEVRLEAVAGRPSLRRVRLAAVGDPPPWPVLPGPASASGTEGPP